MSLPSLQLEPAALLSTFKRSRSRSILPTSVIDMQRSHSDQLANEYVLVLSPGGRIAGMPYALSKVHGPSFMVRQRDEEPPHHSFSHTPTRVVSGSKKENRCQTLITMRPYACWKQTVSESDVCDR